MDSVEARVTIEQAAKWLEAWSVDQAWIASKKADGSHEQQRFADRSAALHDAARDLLTADIWDTYGFVRADGTYEDRPRNGMSAR